MDIESKNTLTYKIYLSKLNKNLVEEINKQIQDIIKNENIIKIPLTIGKNESLIHGKIDYGDRIELEWLVVYVLFELSRLNQDFVIKIYDNDGDILLIEAAEYLPSWLESSDSKNRVFIHKGAIHIIPQHINLKDLHNKYNNHSMTISQIAASFIRDTNNDETSSNSNGTLAELPIRNAIKKQLSGLPDTNIWLSKKFNLLDDIVSGKRVEEHIEEPLLQKRFKESLTLDSIRAMNDSDLRISPFSSATSSLSSSCTSSSSNWITEEELE